MALSLEQANQLKFTVTTPGWTEFYSPDLDRERIQATEILLRTQAERADPKHTDDYLRGYIRGLNFAAGRPFLLIREAERVLQDAKDGPMQGDAMNTAGLGSPYAKESS